MAQQPLTARPFPVMEMWMTEQNIRITLADEKAHLEVTIPKEMVTSWLAKWQAFQDGTETEKTVFGRWYTGAWDAQQEG